jgi:hypothetical protein
VEETGAKRPNDASEDGEAWGVLMSLYRQYSSTMVSPVGIRHVVNSMPTRK